MVESIALTGDLSFNSYDGFIAKISLAPSIAVGGIVPNDSSITTIEAGEWVSVYGVNFTGADATCKFRTSQRRDQLPSSSTGRAELYHPPLHSPNLLLRSTCSMLHTLRASS
jgi:hypothetical protein